MSRNPWTASQRFATRVRRWYRNPNSEVCPRCFHVIDVAELHDCGRSELRDEARLVRQWRAMRSRSRGYRADPSPVVARDD